MNSRESFEMYAQPKKSKAGDPPKPSKKKNQAHQQPIQQPTLKTNQIPTTQKPIQNLKPMPKIPDLNIDQTYMSKSKQVEFLLKRKQIKQNQQIEVMLYLHDNDKHPDLKQKKSKSTQNLLTTNPYQQVPQIGAGIVPF